MVILCQGEFKEVGGKSLSLSLCVSPRVVEERNKPISFAPSQWPKCSVKSKQINCHTWTTPVDW